MLLTFARAAFSPNTQKRALGTPLAICAATHGAGADFPHFVVARRSKIPDLRRSSLLELGQNRLPAPLVGKLITGSRPGGKPGNAVNGKLELDKTNGDGDCHAGYSAQSRRGIRQELRDAIEHPRGSQACGE